MGAEVCQRQCIFLRRLPHISLLTREKQPISFDLKLLNRDLATGVGVQKCIELIVLLHAGFAGRARKTGTEFLKVNTYPVEGEAAAAVGTFNSRQC